MAALIVYGSNVVCHGINKPKGHPCHIVTYKAYRTIHAEVDALVNAPVDLDQNATLYVVRRAHNGDLALAKPCDACLEVIRAAGIKKVVYSINGYPGGRACLWTSGGNYCNYGIIDLRKEKHVL